jgi:uncharacterized repeat protein (TIGR01451 family)
MTVLVAANAVAGAYDNTAVASSTTTDPDSTNNKDTDTLTVGQLVDLSITKSHTGPVHIGVDVPFTLRVTNSGPSAATNVSVSDPLPAALTFVSASGSGWTCTTSSSAGATVVTCDLVGALDPGATARDITVVATVSAAAYPSIPNTASVQTTTPETNLSNNKDTDTLVVPPLVDLSIAKSHRDSLVVGQSATYDITVTNNGPTDDPGPVTVTDTLPTGIRYASSMGAGWSCSDSGQVVTCTYASTLPASAGSNGTTLSLVVDVLPTAYPSVTNSATVGTASEDTDPLNNTATDPAPVTPSVELGLTKVVRSYAGNIATYLIDVTNNGPNVSSSPITVADDLPSGLAYVSATGSGWVCGEVSSLVTCTLGGRLTVGAISTITVTTTVTAQPGSTVTNVATIINKPSTDHVASNDRASADLVVDSPNSDVLPKTGAAWGATILLALALLTFGTVLVLSTRASRTSRTSCTRRRS